MLRFFVFSFLLVSALAARAQGPREIQTGVLRARRVPFSEKRLADLKVPAGFQVSVFAKGVTGARMLLVLPSGAVLVSRTDEGDVLAFGPDGKNRRTVAAGLDGVHGLALSGTRLLMDTPRRVYEATLGPGDSVSKPRVLVDGLPDGGQHPRRTMLFDRDGGFFVSIGSTCNACEEPNAESATILKVSTDGKSRRVFAKGLRNTIGFAFHPTSGELWGMDHGSDMLGDDVPPEELNRLADGKDYGWPWAFGNRQVDPVMKEPKKGPSKAERARASEPMVLGYQAHSAPIGMAFYDGAMFPSDYKGDAFVAFHGSWNRSRAVGYHVARLRFEGGTPKAFEPWLTGFLLPDGQSQFGRPAGVAVAKDGALLVSDDENGVIYRVAYRPGR